MHKAVLKMSTKISARGPTRSGQISPLRKRQGGRSRMKMRSLSVSLQSTKPRPYLWLCVQKAELKDGSKSKSSLVIRAASAPSKLNRNLLSPKMHDWGTQQLKRCSPDFINKTMLVHMISEPRRERLKAPRPRNEPKISSMALRAMSTLSKRSPK